MYTGPPRPDVPVLVDMAREKPWSENVSDIRELLDNLLIATCFVTIMKTFWEVEPLYGLYMFVLAAFVFGFLVVLLCAREKMLLRRS